MGPPPSEWPAQKAPAEAVRFRWEGASSAGRPHAYVIETPTAIFEYLNRGDHIHAVWRDPRGDFVTSPELNAGSPR